MRCRVVVPKVVRLPLSDGDYVDVKATLNAGEYQDLLERVTVPTGAGGVVQVDRSKLGIERLVASVVGWSFVDPTGQPIPYSIDLPDAQRRDALRSVDSGTLVEMITALDAHEAGEVARKNGPDGATRSPAISPSPVGVAGATSGSAN